MRIRPTGLSSLVASFVLSAVALGCGAPESPDEGPGDDVAAEVGEPDAGTGAGGDGGAAAETTSGDVETVEDAAADPTDTLAQPGDGGGDSAVEAETDGASGDAPEPGDLGTGGACLADADCVDDGDPCTDTACVDGTCAHVFNSAPCDDGDGCTLDDTCDQGVCTGAPLVCPDDGDPCTEVTCIDDGCATQTVTGPCDDGDPCTADDQCAEGTCAGTPLVCDPDEDPCTDTACVEGVCTHAFNSAPCDDGDLCTLDDACVEGACVGGAAPCEDDGNPCTDEVCLDGDCTVEMNDGPCDDGDPCTLEDVCAMGVCGGVSVVCEPDADPCTDTACVDGACAHLFNSAPCDDGDPCTDVDVCQEGSCVGAALSCPDDGDACTDEVCVEGECTHPFNTSPCDDGDTCTAGDVCSEGVCAGTPVVCISDGDVCTDDVCVDGMCSFPFNNAPCDDGDACTALDVCSEGVCSGVDSGCGPLAVNAPFGAAPPDPLTDSGMTSCAVYQQERCVDGQLERCEVYSVEEGVFVEPDPLLRRVLLYDRYYDLHHQPDGLTLDLHFVDGIPAGTPEESWSSMDSFSYFGGDGDSALWTSVALISQAMRYLSTGTAADYERMKSKARAVLSLFDVTGIPGFLARNYYLAMPPGGPLSTKHYLRHLDPSGYDHRDHVITDADAIAGLPAAYSEGIPGPDGVPVMGTPKWHGNPSVDQYSGPMVSLPLVYALLDDEAMRDKITEHLTCFLKRLERIDIINVQGNPMVLQGLQTYLAGNSLVLDPDDNDPMAVKKIVLYVLRQPNSLNVDTFDTACPDTLPTEPVQVLDATHPLFILDMIALVQDMASGANERPNGIDHVHAPNVRGGDAIRMMMLAAMAHWLTGDPMYEAFLEEDLIGELDTIGVAKLAGSFTMPKFCRPYYAPHILFPSVWMFIRLLGPSTLRNEMVEVMEGEIWQKLMAPLGNAKFQLMYADVVPDSVGSDQAAALSQALGDIETLGGNGGEFDELRRNYNVDPGWVAENMPEGNFAVCPTEAERAACEDGATVFGIPVEGESISTGCSGSPAVCQLGDACFDMQAAYPMPMHLRVWEDYLWQRNPYKIGSTWGTPGDKQSPGLDLTEPYWMARRMGFIEQGEGQVLAWHPVASCN